MTYSIAVLRDPYRGIYDIIDGAVGYEEAWRQAAVHRRACPQHIFIVLSTETREDPKLTATSRSHIRT